MRIKRYVARDMQEAVALIKQDMGPEAVIISSRRVPGPGILGFMAPQLEVTAALDERQVHKVNNPNCLKPEEEFCIKPGFDNARTWQQDVQLRQELLEMKELLLRFSRSQKIPFTEGNALLLKLRELLAEMEIKEEIVAELMEAVEKEISCEPKHESSVEAILINRITRMVEPVYEDGGAARISIFIGPTGVGKTTTLAKLAAQFRLFHQKNVALITIDTYRIGAVEQLRTYAEIIDVPLEVAMTPNELEQALSFYNQIDHILIDTAGRPSNNLRQVLELKGFIEAIPKPCDVYLVLSCNTKYRDNLRVAEDFSRLNYNKLIFTKLDETGSFGSILNLIRHVGLPVVYVTNGQSVPEDIETFYPRKLAELLLKGGGGYGSGLQAANPR